MISVIKKKREKREKRKQREGEMQRLKDIRKGVLQPTSRNRCKENNYDKKQSMYLTRFWINH